MSDDVQTQIARLTTPVRPLPAVHEPTARRVYTYLGLPELFAHAADRRGMAATLVHVEQLAEVVADYVRTLDAHRVTVADGPLVRKVRLAESLAALGVGTGPVFVTGCDAAVAETGTIAFRGGVPAGWRSALGRVVVVEPKVIVPDLIDFFAAVTGDVTTITGSAGVRVFVLH